MIQAAAAEMVAAEMVAAVEMSVTVEMAAAVEMTVTVEVAAVVGRVRTGSRDAGSTLAQSLGQLKACSAFTFSRRPCRASKCQPASTQSPWCPLFPERRTQRHQRDQR